MKKFYPLVGITLEGFQVFDKPTYIPLDGLTLFFGPNSAGKSAVQDALEFCEILRNAPADSQLAAFHGHTLFGRSHYRNSIHDLLHKHWRRTNRSGDQVGRLSMAVKYKININNIIFGFDSNQDNTIEYRWTFQGETDVTLGFELFFQSQFLVGNYPIEGGCALSINAGFLKYAKVDFVELIKLYPAEFIYKDGLFTTLGTVSGFQCCGKGQGVHPELLRYYPKGMYEHKEINYDLCHATMEKIGTALWHFLNVCDAETDHGWTTKVSASRTVPSRDDLTFQTGEIKDDFVKRFLPDGNPSYRSLAESLLGVGSQYRGSEFAQAVNRALTDHLFIEHGYRIDCEYRLFLTEAHSEAIKTSIEDFKSDSNEDDDENSEYEFNVSLKVDEVGYLVELFLRDGKGRRHSFEDVGSGIGYVLPVLCAVFSGGRGFIQQPELHLHPALQAAMGDVIVEANTSGNQILIETHSEHLLLRILKRVRQTHLKVDIAQELKINAEDVCVLYFDPSPDGTTTVKRLRVTEDGEFMDRWPRGFFGERDQELLDE
jgi:AAA domain, putative AbiEii toxin, Type IV TA system/AAA domain/Protein of unknown function (DUF3696)